MFQKKWFRWTKNGLLIVSLLLCGFFIRELIVYKPFSFTYRFKTRIKRIDFLNEKLDLAELKSDSTIILFTLGQSNAANSSDIYYNPHNPMLNYYDGSLYKAEEPLMGASGDGGCVWTILADRLIDSGWCKKVIIIPIAEGGATAERWARGDYHEKLIKTLDDLIDHDITPTFILWHQGESDNGHPTGPYKKDLGIILETIRGKGFNAPFFCAVASYSIGALDTKPLGIDTALQNAQRDFIKHSKNVYMGPFTDSMIYAFQRHDTQHFSLRGNFEYSLLWYNSLMAYTNEMKKSD